MSTPNESAPVAPNAPEAPATPESAVSAQAAAAPDDGASPDSTATGSAPEGAQRSPAEVAAELKQRFPGLFGGAAKPLKLRIQADIQERAPGVFTKQALSAFLRRYTGSTAYLVAVSKAAERFDLDGQPAGELSAEHREVAATELARRREITQARRKEEAKAQREQARQSDQAAFEARRAEHEARRARHQLLRDFERTTLTEANFCALKGIAPAELAATLAQARQEAAEPRPAGKHRGPRREGGAATDRPRGDRGGRPDRADHGGRADRPARSDRGPRPGRGPRGPKA